jgi:hypothetical protein
MLIAKTKPKRWEKNLPERHLDYHKSNVKFPGIDSLLLLVEANN